MIKIIFCLVFTLLVSGCDNHITKELTCSKDMSKYFVGEANLKEGETSPYNRTVQTNFQFLYTEDEKEIKRAGTRLRVSVLRCMQEFVNRRYHQQARTEQSQWRNDNHQGM